MRYFPGLIPERSRILPDYFKGNIYEATKKNPIKNTLMWVIGVFFLLSALISLAHPSLMFLLALVGFILIPPGQQLIEKMFRFSLTTAIKVTVCAALFIASLPLSYHYSIMDRRAVLQQKLIDEKVARETLVLKQKDQQRRDSLDFYIRQGSQSAKNHKIDEANQWLEHALVFATTPTEKELITKERIRISAVKASDLIKAGKYQIALPEINNLLELDPSNTELAYDRALCYSKTGKIQEAVNDLKPLIQSGNVDAEKLHNKINPVRKRITGYETLCCDGSTSYATGRGACSHHGGVCDWNHPVYEEYRKYE